MNRAEALIQQLNLKPLPEEGGFYNETYRAEGVIVESALKPIYPGKRCFSTAIYYLLTPVTFSALHRLPGDELFHFYYGDPVEIFQIFPEGDVHKTVIGCDIEAGVLPQAIIQANTWQGSRLLPGGQVALMGVTVSPGFEFEDYENGNREILIQQYPQHSEMIMALIRV